LVNEVFWGSVDVKKLSGATPQRGAKQGQSGAQRVQRFAPAPAARAKALALAGELGPTEAARVTGIPRGTISGWIAKENRAAAAARVVPLPARLCRCQRAWDARRTPKLDDDFTLNLAADAANQAGLAHPAKQAILQGQSNPVHVIA
jgi:hypothetical protein